MSEKGVIIREYNALLTELQGDGHKIIPLGRNKVHWVRGIGPRHIDFRVREEGTLVEHYLHGVKKAEKVVGLMKRIQDYYAGVYSRDKHIETAHDNLQAILNSMLLPLRLQALAHFLAPDRRSGARQQVGPDIEQALKKIAQKREVVEKIIKAHGIKSIAVQKFWKGRQRK